MEEDLEAHKQVVYLVKEDVACKIVPRSKTFRSGGELALFVLLVRETPEDVLHHEAGSYQPAVAVLGWQRRSCHFSAHIADAGLVMEAMLAVTED